MRTRLAAAALAVTVFCAVLARADDLKAFKLTIDGVVVDIDPGEDMDVDLARRQDEQGADRPQ
ncbi:hypothetical protein [Mesorhizobium sp. LjNodule214]|uniref:hypothetical protein n=1 Tax=Mesorhizobium sp. LjNodule214 TaxID=3342252 RepID=UPI003ECC2F52